MNQKYGCLTGGAGVRHLNSLREKHEEKEEVEYFKREASLGLDDFEKSLINGPMKERGYVLDAGCGAGREAIALTLLGYRLKAIDISAAMIEAAKKEAEGKGLEIDFERLEITELNYRGVFDYCLFSGGVYNSIPGRALRMKALEKAMLSLRPEGLLFLPIGIARFPRNIFSRSFFKARIYAGLKSFLGNSFKPDPGDAFISRLSPASNNKIKVYHHFFFSFPEIEDELRGSGFAVRMLEPGLWQISRTS